MRRAQAAMLSLVCTLGLVLSTPAPAQASSAPASPAIRTQVHLRDSGYVLGDLIEQRVRFDLPHPMRLIPESLPSPGPVQHWLELRTVDWHDRDGELVLRYQIFAAVEHSLRLALPRVSLRFDSARGEVVASAAEQTFYLSPVLPPSLSADDQTARASPIPQTPRSAAGLRLIGWALLAVLLGLALAWHADRLPWLWRRPGPLTRLHRGLRRTRGEHTDPEIYRTQLARIHRAFADCTGHTLYRHNLDDLFAHAPYLRPLQAEISAFFEHAHQHLYQRDAPPMWPVQRLLDLCRDAMQCERSLGRPRAAVAAA